MSDTERPEVYRTPLGQEQFGIVAKPLTLFELLYNQDWLRKLFVLVIITVLWETYARWLDNELLVPTFSATVRALAGGIASSTIPARALLSIAVLLMGFAAGVSLAAVLTFFAISSRIGTDFLETMTAMFNPLPAIALLPLALIWFGLGTGSLVFVLVHSVLWAVALNTHAGFRSVSNTHRMVGAKLRAARHLFCRANSHPCGFSQHSCRFQDRLGFRLAHPDCSGAGIWHDIGPGRPRLVHLRGEKSARYPGSVRWPAVDHPDWSVHRKRRVSPNRDEDG
jgi:hypothetical protein